MKVTTMVSIVIEPFLYKSQHQKFDQTKPQMLKNEAQTLELIWAVFVALW